MNDVYDDIESGRTRGGGVSAVAEEVRRVRDRRREVDRRRDDVTVAAKPSFFSWPAAAASAPALRDEPVDDERSCPE